MKTLLQGAALCKVRRKPLWSAQFLQLAFTQKGIKTIKSLEGKLLFTDIAALRADVCI